MTTINYYQIGPRNCWRPIACPQCRVPAAANRHMPLEKQDLAPPNGYYGECNKCGAWWPSFESHSQCVTYYEGSRTVQDITPEPEPKVRPRHLADDFEYIRQKMQQMGLKGDSGGGT